MSTFGEDFHVAREVAKARARGSDGHGPPVASMERVLRERAEGRNWGRWIVFDLPNRIVQRRWKPVRIEDNEKGLYAFRIPPSGLSFSWLLKRYERACKMRADGQYDSAVSRACSPRKQG